MKLALLNTFAFHFEMFGHIIEYCLLKNIRLDIFTEFENDLGWIKFYIFNYIPGNENQEYDLNKQDNKLIRFYPFNVFTSSNDYTKVILATDDDLGVPNEIINEKFICIDHHITNRRPQVPIHISIRDYKKNIDWTFPVYKIIDIESKTKISKPIISCIGRFNCPKDISKFKNLFKNFNNFTFAMIDRHLQDYIEIYRGFSNINCFPELNTTQMYNLLIQSDYIFISDENEDHCSVSLSAAIPLGLNCLCQLIMPEKMNEHLNLKSVITYSEKNKIELSKPDLNLINKELSELITHKIKVFDKHLINEEPIIESNLTFDLKMICQENNANYILTKSLIPELGKYTKIDSINNYEYYKTICIDNNILTSEHLCNCDKNKELLSFTLSHINLWKDFVEKSNKNWLLVLSDDIKLNNYNSIIVELLIGNTDSNFIQLYCDKKNLNEQIKTKKINFNLFKMIEQDCSVYLINKKGIELLLSKLPFYDTIGKMISNNIDELNALCFVNTIFVK